MKTKIFRYTVVFLQDSSGGYTASVPLLPGCVTQGEDLEEAKENIKEAIEVYIETLKEDGDEIPTEEDECLSTTISVPLKV